MASLTGKLKQRNTVKKISRHKTPKWFVHPSEARLLYIVRLQQCIYLVGCLLLAFSLLCTQRDPLVVSTTYPRLSNRVQFLTPIDSDQIYYKKFHESSTIDPNPTMELLMDTIFRGGFFIFVAIVLLIFRFTSLSTTKRAPYPPGPPAWPVIGNYFEFKSLFLRPEKRLREWTSRYGDITQLWIGPYPAILINSAETAKDLLDKVHTL